MTFLGFKKGYFEVAFNKKCKKLLHTVLFLISNLCYYSKIIAIKSSNPTIVFALNRVKQFSG